MNKFPEEVIRKLGYYVYRLIDPRDGQTFYVGKGKGNRVFAHVQAAVDIEQDDVGPDPKLATIRAIRNSNLEVIHVIHRHGLEEDAALQVEAALIDAYAGLDNAAGGYGSDFGPMHATQLIEKYAAPEAKLTHKAIFINISRAAEDADLYEATRYAWKISTAKAQQADVVLATIRGIIRDAFIQARWMPATTNNFPGRLPHTGRYGFEARPATPEIRAQYVGKRVPDIFRKRGAANPVKYSWK